MAVSSAGVHTDPAEWRAESKLHFQAQLLAAVKDAVVAIDAQQIITYWNAGAEAIYGWSAMEAVGRPIADLLSTEFDGLTRADAIRSALATGENRTEVRQRRRDGTSVTIESVVRVLRDGDGQFLGMVAVNRDISARQLTDASLREAHERLEAVLASVVDTHVILDRQWRYSYVNEVGLKTIGRPRAEVLGHTVWEIFPSLLGTPLESAYRRAMDERLSGVFDFQNVATGQWWEIRFHPAPEGLAVFASNISERKRAELERSQLAAIVESSDDAILSKTLAGVILSWNAGAERLYGYTAPEIIGQSVSMLVPADRSDELANLMERLGRGERIRRFETQRRRKDGTLVDVSVTLSPIRDSAGAIAGASSIARDITQQRQVAEINRRAGARTTSLLRVAAALSSRLELERVIQTVCVETCQVMDVPIATLTLFNEAQAVFEFAGGAGLPRELVERMRPIPLAFYGQQLQPGAAPFLTPDVRAESGWPNAAIHQTLNMRTNVIVMMFNKARPLGTLRIATTGSVRRFDPEALQLLQGLADIAALAIANAQLFQEVSAGRGRLHALSQRLLEVQEVERGHIARQLHDEIGQALTAAKINLQALQRAGSQPAGGPLDDSIGILEETLQHVRSLSMELRPALLDDLGLAAALRWYVDRQAQRGGFAARVTANLLDARLPAEVETTCFRVTQEAMTNILRHARAATVEVQVSQAGGQLELTIQDDGAGFDVPAALALAGRGGSLGLLGMQERVLLVGGVLKIESSPNRGCRLWARFPLETLAPVERRGGGRTDA